jgi:hypothetical protein
MVGRKRFWAPLAILLTSLLLIPPDVAAQAAQHAGQVTIVIPIAEIQRTGERVPAQVKKPVFWGDVVNTGHLARARLTLDDGSVLNVGSDSLLRVLKHDAANQQTDLELTYGQVRANAVKMTKPGSGFQVRTPTAVAGVVGTDFFLGFENFITQLIVFQGKVQFCNLGGACIEVGAGMASAVRGNNAPDQPVTATTANVTTATTSTAPSGPGGAGAGAGAGVGGVATGTVVAHSALFVGVMAVAVAVPVAVIRSVAKTPTCACQKTVTAGQATIVNHGRPGAVLQP